MEVVVSRGETEYSRIWKHEEYGILDRGVLERTRDGKLLDVE